MNYLDKIFSDFGAIEHRVECRDFIHTYRGELQDIGHLQCSEESERTQNVPTLFIAVNGSQPPACLCARSNSGIIAACL